MNNKEFKEWLDNVFESIPSRSDEFNQIPQSLFEGFDYEEAKEIRGLYTKEGYPFTIEIIDYPILTGIINTKEIGREVVLKVYYTDDSDTYYEMYGGEISLATKYYKEVKK